MEVKLFTLIIGVSQCVSQVSSACTQAAVQLFRFYCQEKRCLDCAIGNALLRRGAMTTSSSEYGAQHPDANSSQPDNGCRFVPG